MWIIAFAAATAGSGTCQGTPNTHDGACQPGGAVSQATLCCQKVLTPECFDGIVNDTSDVSSFVRDCAYTEFQAPTPVVVGTCGPSGVCVPAH